MDANAATDFGSRFSETWSLLQAYLGDLDDHELASLSGKEVGATLELLRAQPAVGQAKTLDSHARKGPEALAIAIVRERLEALENATTGETWGARFLARWRSLGGPLSSFRYEQIQRIKAGDQEEVARIVRPGLMMGGYGVAQMIRNSTPEEAAEKILNQMRVAALTMAMIWL